MAHRIRRSRSLQWMIPLVALAAIFLAGCPKPAEAPADEIAVTSTSAEFEAAAQALQEPCRNPAEFGRCGCTLDGFQAPCDLVAWCLEVGFCEAERAAGDTPDVTTESEIYRRAATNLLPVCRLPAEFGRCTCTIDGIETSCDLVQRCLRNGFCVATAG